MSAHDYGLEYLPEVLTMSARIELLRSIEEYAETYSAMEYQADQGTGEAVSRTAAAHDTSRAYVLAQLGLNELQANPRGALATGDQVWVEDPELGRSAGVVVGLNARTVSIEGAKLDAVRVLSWSIDWDEVHRYVSKAS